MRHVILLLLLCVVVAGCATIIPDPGIDGYTGTGTIVVNVKRHTDVTFHQRLQPNLSPLGAPVYANEPVMVIIKVSKSIPDQHHETYIEKRPYTPGGVSLQLDVPAGTTYVASALLVDEHDRLIELGVHWDIGVLAETTTIVDVEMGPPNYAYNIPHAVHRTDPLLVLHGDSDHPMIGDENVSILIGPEPWNVDRPPYTNGPNVKADVLQHSFESVWPNIDYPHTFYWQVEICAQPRYSPTAIDRICMYEPSVERGEPLYELIVQ